MPVQQRCQTVDSRDIKHSHRLSSQHPRPEDPPTSLLVSNVKGSNISLPRPSLLFGYRSVQNGVENVSAFFATEAVNEERNEHWSAENEKGEGGDARKRSWDAFESNEPNSSISEILLDFHRVSMYLPDLLEDGKRGGGGRG